MRRAPSDASYAAFPMPTTCEPCPGNTNAMVTRAQGYAPPVPRTSLCDLLGIEHPILSVGFGPTAGPELVAAVSAAGGCGVLGGSNVPPAALRERIRAVRDRTDRPFGVNLLLHQPQLLQLDVCVE